VACTQNNTDRKAALKAKLIELLKGNSIKKDIFSKSGELLFEKGTILSGEDIKISHEEGAKVLIEISWI
jgi:cytoskeletal protein CcmA (bactofilin family)